jgi:hypothetical protein
VGASPSTGIQITVGLVPSSAGGHHDAPPGGWRGSTPVRTLWVTAVVRSGWSSDPLRSTL